MAIENSVSTDFLSTFVDSIDVFDCSLPGVITHAKLLAFRSYKWYEIGKKKYDL